MASTAEVGFFARVDIAERIGVLIERMARTHGDAPIDEEYLDGDVLAELFRDDEPPAPAALRPVRCDGCRGTGRMWFGTGLEAEQVAVECCACGGEGQVEPGEEPGDLPDDEGA